MQEVEYRPIPHFPNYRVGSDGSIWSNIASRRSTGIGTTAFHLNFKTGAWKQLKPSADPRGYKIVTLSCIGQKRRSYPLHKLVLLAFRGPAEQGQQARHLNDDKSNNSVENLAWGTASQNGQDKTRNGVAARGEKQWAAKLTEADVIKIRELAASGARTLELSRMFKVGVLAIYRAKTRKTWSHI